MKKTILFQGDSITDCGRVRGEDLDTTKYMGMGYPNLIASELSVDYPDKFNFLNRGVSGDKIPNLYPQLQTKTHALCLNSNRNIIKCMV